MHKLLLLTALILFFKYSSAQNAGDSLFGSSQVHTISLDFSQPSYWDSLTNYYTLDKDMECDVTIDGQLVPSCGVKFKGNSSYNNPGQKKSFKVDIIEFVSGQKYDGLKKFNLNNCFKDPTFMREKLMLDFCRSKGIVAPRCTYANVYINGQLWGLYTIVEEVDNTFLEQTFGNKDGNLFKGDPSGDLRWMGSAPSNYYSKYELHTNSDVNDWSDLVRLIDKLNNSSAAQLRDSLDNVLRTYEYAAAWTVSSLFANLDSYVGSGHNYYIYHNTADDKFHWIVWDVHKAIGNFSMSMTVPQIEVMSLYYLPSQSRPLNQKMIHNSYYKGMLTYIACEYVQRGFTAAELFPKIDSIAGAIRAHVYADPKKTYSNQQFEENINNNISVPTPGGSGTVAGLKSFITNRRSALLNQLTAIGCYTPVETTDHVESISIYPNPFTEDISITSTFGREISLKLYTVQGSALAAFTLETGQAKLLATGSFYLQPGIYLLEVVSGESRVMKRIVKQ